MTGQHHVSGPILCQERNRVERKNKYLIGYETKTRFPPHLRRQADGNTLMRTGVCGVYGAPGEIRTPDLQLRSSGGCCSIQLNYARSVDSSSVHRGHGRLNVHGPTWGPLTGGIPLLTYSPEFWYQQAPAAWELAASWVVWAGSVAFREGLPGRFFRRARTCRQD